jgi:histidyl-tRNA synthetase
MILDVFRNRQGNVLSAVHNALSAFRSVAYKCNSEAMTFEELKTIVDNATAIYRRYGKIKTFTPLVQRLGISLQKTSFGTQINPIIASIVSMKDTDGDDEAMQSEDESSTSRIVFSSSKLNQIRHFD